MVYIGSGSTKMMMHYQFETGRNLTTTATMPNKTHSTNCDCGDASDGLRGQSFLLQRRA